MINTAIKKAQQHENQLTSIHSDLLQVHLFYFVNLHDVEVNFDCNDSCIPHSYSKTEVAWLFQCFQPGRIPPGGI